MAKAKRPIFVPVSSGTPYVSEQELEFEWFAGFALLQKQKSIESLHQAAKAGGISPVLEISSKSLDPLGIALSSFNLKLKTPQGQQISVECAFQGSKVFQNGGPYTELYFVTSREAKTDERLRNSGEVVGFNYFGQDYPIRPVNAFYNRLYLFALWSNPNLAEKITQYKGFSDIEYNPKKSINCQARSAALFVSLQQQGLLEKALKDRDFYQQVAASMKQPAILPMTPSKQKKLFPDE
jgi:hypothetical protein